MWFFEGGGEVIQYAIQMTLKGPSKFVKVPFSNMPIRALGRLAKRDPVEGEAINLFCLGVQEERVNSVGISGSS